MKRLNTRSFQRRLDQISKQVEILRKRKMRNKPTRKTVWSCTRCEAEATTTPQLTDLEDRHPSGWVHLKRANTVEGWLLCDKCWAKFQTWMGEAQGGA